ncbi:beta-lactamase family protein [Nonomuraea sp. KC401]|uniref:serine hydrolase domain-containing protein n=1 Tax=unclassified Nonomuraea TaxID=2593643 RepID=UPI0010FDD9C0|nr:MULTISPECIES: serine hydrolase domain-containing protein [unclassified Nonomuraea]NBE93402.1 serine hydrolase [Nonomuraea sp. K271]TLF74961.1 beta-lactamase family protein [Nonomuraea sp. KC401]
MLSRRRLLQAGAGAVPAITLGTAPAWAESAEPPTTGVVPKSMAVLDKALKAYIKERGISCAQLAVAKKGKLLLARGYGSYTRPDGSTAKVLPTSLFRIASLSKSLTAAAIVRLAQDGELSLGDKVADVLKLSTRADPRLAKVNLWRLLQHTGGWDRGVTTDPLWNDATIAASLDVPLPIDHDDIIKYTTAKKLDFAPGSKYAYSNYGYMLAGRVIEEVSGLPYETYVRHKLLAPVDIERMRLGRSLRSEAARNEVHYESKYTRKSVVDPSGATVPYPYGGFSMPNQDANGGWLASAVDLVKWGFVFDGAGPVLSSTSISRVFAKPEIGANSGGSWYGLGWQVRKNNAGGLNTWHNGSMPGTSSFFARVQHGISYCAIFNHREEEGTPDFDAIDPILGKAIGKVKTWPTADLTTKYF